MSDEKAERPSVVFTKPSPAKRFVRELPEWLPVVIVGGWIGAGVALFAVFTIAYGIVGGCGILTILIIILERIWNDDWHSLATFALAAALIGGFGGAGAALVAGFDMARGFVGGGILLAIILPILTQLVGWQGEGIVWAFQAYILLATGGGIGAVVALVAGAAVVDGVVWGGVVASILPVFGWLTGFWNRGRSS